MIKIKRAYDRPSASDGFRVLVDRLWPRGVHKSDARLDLWLKDIAPSDALRRRFAHDPARWGEFRKAYDRELDEKKDLIDQLKKLEHENRALTLVFAAKDETHNNAAALRDRLGNARTRRP